MHTLLRNSLIVLLALPANPRESRSAGEPATAKARREFDPYKAFGFREDLRYMREPSLRPLAAKDRAATVYRFLWSPSFHGPVSVRFVKTEQGGVLHAVRLSCGWPYDSGKTIIRTSKSVKLSRASWKRIEDHLTNAQFWTLPTHGGLPFGMDSSDGHSLLVEGVRDGKYHVVLRVNPLQGKFVDLCQSMLFMSGFDVRKLWFEYRW